MNQKIEQFKANFQQNEGKYSLAFFVGGFIWDIFMTGALDDWTTIVQQVVYILIVALMLSGEIRETVTPLKMPNFLRKTWTYREPIIHFFLGNLLNFSSIFYYKSASIAASFVFFSILIILLAANELPQFRKYGLILRSILFTLCLCSVIAILIPVFVGFVGFVPFFAAVVLSGFLFYVFARFTLRGIDKNHLAHKQLVYPSLTTLLVFTLMYLFNLIPPVPISVQFAGVYHKVERENGEYVLYSETPTWKFWKRGDQDFVAQPGDKIHFFANIFSPTGFNDKILIHWYFKDPRQGWVSADKIPMTISGGRAEGFRGHAYKSNYQAGEWRVHVESDDGREISRLPIDITIQDTETPREFHIERR